jgi:Kdo2-lipid IVA lauroyltransferase/acyltransferase
MFRSNGIVQLTRSGAKATSDALLGSMAAGMLRAVRALDRERTADFAGRMMSTFGPWLKEHRIGRANLAAAFPEKSAAEIESLLLGVWDNLGRVAAEFAHIDRLKTFDPDPQRLGDIVYSGETHERLHQLRSGHRPALIFTAHLANWEVLTLLAANFQLNTAVLYRRPNISAVNDAVTRIRKGIKGGMIPTSPDAPLKLARILEGGGSVCMLADQYFVNGVDVTFFGRRCKANPLIARLARLVDCAIHGVRIVRLPDRHHFLADLTEAIAPARAADGRIDVAGTMQVITSVIEGWVREHPEQWLWVHRRWR